MGFLLNSSLLFVLKQFVWIETLKSVHMSTAGIKRCAFQCVESKIVIESIRTLEQD